MRRLVAAGILLSCSRQALARCGSTTLSFAADSLAYVHPHGVDSMRPGMPLHADWTWPLGISYFFDLADCSAFGSRVEVYPSKAPIPGLVYSDGVETAAIFPTGVDGIGYVAQLKDPAAPWTYLRSPSAETFNPAIGAWDYLGMLVRVRFVLTGPLKPGTYVIPPQTLATANAYARGSATPLTAPGVIALDGGNVLTITAGSCKMTTPPHQAIALPTVGSAALPAVGANAGKGVSFHIGVNCDANVALHVTMTDASHPTNTSNVLALAKDSTASGVGVQLFRDGLSAAVPYGPDSSVPGNANQWLIGSSTSETSYTLPFTAAYVRTGALTPGSVIAKATFTFSYQ